MKKFFIALIGGTLLLVGVVLLVLPGPGLAIIVAGLAVLATEFYWARRWLRKAKQTATRAGKWAGRQSWWQRLAARFRRRPPTEKPTRSPVSPCKPKP